MFMGQRVPALYHGQSFENYYLAGSQKATGYIQEINMVIVQMENVLVRKTFLIQNVTYQTYMSKNIEPFGLLNNF